MLIFNVDMSVQEDTSNSEDIFDKFKSEDDNTLSSNDDLESDNKEITFVKIFDDTQTEIRFIYHLSDILIRNTIRHTEYKHVFERLYRKLRSLIGSREKISLIVMTGNIFHTRTEFSPESFTIAIDLFKNLTSIAPVIVIAGQSDSCPIDSGRQDVLSTIVANFTIKNLYYFQNTGIYQYHNLIFGSNSPNCSLLINSNKINSDVWDCIKQKRKYKLALFHGLIESNNSAVRISDFQGYDYVLMGGEHNHRIICEKPFICYPGSLIQQSFDDHNGGLLQWDLFDNEVISYSIKNDYGYCTIPIINGKNKFKPDIPRKPRLRYVINNTSEDDFQKIRQDIESKYQVQESIVDRHIEYTVDSVTNNKVATNNATETQIEMIRTYLSEKNICESDITAILDLHTNIKEDLDCELSPIIPGTDISQSINGRKWKLLELKFSNTLAYGKDNVIDFRPYGKNKVIGIFAPNHYGKTSIMDVVLFCLFEKFSRGDRKSIIHNNENRCHCSLLLEIDGQEYLVERSCIRNNINQNVKVSVNLLRNIDGEFVNCNGPDKLSTEKRIAKLIGTFDDYLTTCFSFHQGRSSNFTDMSQLQKKEYLSEILKLNIFDKALKISKTRIKKLQSQRQELDIQKTSIEDLRNSIQKIRSELFTTQNKYNHNQKLLECIKAILSKFSSSPQLTIYDELKSYRLGSLKDILDTIQYLNNQLRESDDTNIRNVTAEIIEVKKQLEQLFIDQETHNNASYDYNDSMVPINTIIGELDNLHRQKYKIKEHQETPESIEESLQTIDQKLEAIQSILADPKRIDINYVNNHDRISSIRQQIQNLQQNIRPIGSNRTSTNDNENLEKIRVCDVELTNLHQKLLIEAEEICNQVYQINLESLKKKRLYLENQHRIVEKIKLALGSLDSYDFTDAECPNSQIVRKIIENHRKIVDIYEKSWDNLRRLEVESQDENRKWNKSNVEEFFNQITQVKSTIREYCLDYIDLYHNRKINSQILEKEEELNQLLSYQEVMKESENLRKEQELLEERKKMLIEKRTEITDAKNQQLINKDLDKKIIVLQKHIDNHNSRSAAIQVDIKRTRNRIDELEKISSQQQVLIEETKRKRRHLRLLNKFHMEYLVWSKNTWVFNHWNDQKTKLENEIIQQKIQIDHQEKQLDQLKIDIDSYLKHREQLDKLTEDIRINQLYAKIMNPNGLPFSMLTMYLPLIESNVNRVLHTMVNFSIEFVFGNNSSDIETNAKTSNIDLKIKYDGIKSYNAYTGCGFENFIISLAIRMVLCKISLTTKPDFLIIDEGWTGLDSENLANVGAILDHIKKMYKHVFIISHLDALKSQTDHIINIDRQGHYSRISGIPKTKSKKMIKC